MLLGSKMEPFQLGCPVIISCTGTPVCGACKAWCIIQDHKQTQTPPDAPFLQIDGRALDHLILVRHIKAIVAKLGLNPSRYSGHKPLYWGSYICCTSRALPMTNKATRPVEQSDPPTVYTSGPAYVHWFCCPHGSQLMKLLALFSIKVTRPVGMAWLVA